MHVESSTALGRLRRLELSPTRFLQLTLVSLGALWLIVLTGAAVRVTDSGLGCRHWPGCEAGHPLPAKDYHAFIEFGNRALGGIVIALVLLTTLASFFTPSLPRRGRRLALAIFAGTLAQAPLGYLAVHSDLNWPVVAAHLLLSMAVIAGAVVLALEALALRSGRVEPIVPRELRRAALAVAASAAVLLVTGTLATAGGPHSGGGEADHVDRLWRLQPLVYVHGAGQQKRPQDLKDELQELVPPLDGVPSESEMRVAQAQLVGWLEGLFHGIQAAMFAQQMAARQQFEELRRRGLMAQNPQQEQPGAPPRGQYL